MGIALRRYAAEAPQHPARRFAPDPSVDQRGCLATHSPSLALPQKATAYGLVLVLKVKAVVGLVGAAAQGRGTDCQYARGICVAPLRRPAVESPAASERREGLFDVEVDAEEQE